MPEPSPQQRAALRPYVESGFLGIVEKLAKEMTAPFWWSDPTVVEEMRQIQGGTMCFVHTGKQLLGVTAAHIHREFETKKTRQPALHCQVGGHTFEPEKYLFDIDDDLDIAVYHISEVQVAAARAHIHTAPSWPPINDPTQPHWVGGWLWNLAERDRDQVHHYFAHYIAKLTDHTERSTVVWIGKSTSVPWGNASIPTGANLGGMSGGPIYRLNEEGLSVLTLVGIVSEYSVALEYFRARPLSLLGDVGQIIRA